MICKVEIILFNEGSILKPATAKIPITGINSLKLSPVFIKKNAYKKIANRQINSNQNLGI